MKIGFFLVADYAIRSNDGKMSIMGIFDTINVPMDFNEKKPLVHPSLTVAFQIQDVPLDYKGAAKISIENATSKQKIFDEKIDILMKPGTNNFTSLATIKMLTIEKLGDYLISLEVGGEKLAEKKLTIARA